MKESIQFLNDNINNNSTVVVAVSTGPDSMALLNLLLKIRNNKNLKIIVAHVNHNIRKQSIEEYKFLKNYLKDKDCILEYYEIKDKLDKSVENKARNIRYNFFEEVIKKYRAKYLLTAHHRDDLVETILMKLTRGSSLNGYVGIKKISKRNNYLILRPLLFYTKDDILKYLDKNNIPYYIDETNFDKSITRNRYRLDILPLLKKENKNIHLKYLEFSESLEENNNFVNNYISEKYLEIFEDNYLKIDKLLKEDIFVIKKIIYKYLFLEYKNKINLINKKHITNIINILNSDRPYLKINLPNKKILVKDYNKLYFCNNNLIADNYKIKIDKEVKLPFGIIKKVDSTKLTNNFVCHLNSKSIKLPLYVRNKRDGDFIEILNMNGKRKVKDIFIDEKINKDERKNYPVVVDSNNNIVWIPGLKKSKYDVLKSGKYDIILWYKRGGN